MLNKFCPLDFRSVGDDRDIDKEQKSGEYARNAAATLWSATEKKFRKNCLIVSQEESLEE